MIFLDTLVRGIRKEGLNPYWGLLAYCVVSPLSIAASNAAWVATLVMCLLKGRANTSWQTKRTPLDPAWALYVIASLVSVFVSLDPVSSLWESRALGLLVIYYLFAWNTQTTPQRRNLISVLLGAAGLASLYGIVQFFTGWDALGHYKPDTGRASGFFSLYLTFGEYLVIVSCTGLGICLWKKGARAKGILIPVLALMLMGIALSGSKGAYLGLLTGWGCVFATRGRRYLVGFLGGLVLVGFLLSSLCSIDLSQSMGTLFRVDVAARDSYAASNTQRLFMWWAGFRISPQYFLNGVGMHALGKIYPAFRHSLAREPNQWHLHSSFMQIGVTEGIFGLAAFLFACMLALRMCRQGVSSCAPLDRGLSAGLLGGLAGFLVCGLTENCWEDSEIQMLLYALLGLQASVLIGVKRVAPATQTAGSAMARVRPLMGSLERIVLPALLLGLVAAPWVLRAEEAPPNVRMRVLEGLSAVALCAQMGKRSQGYGQRSGYHSLMSSLVVFAGYTLTRRMWICPEVYFGNSSALWGAVGALFFFIVLAATMYRRRLGEIAHTSPFDAAVIAALVLWMVLCVCTHGLLKVASLQGAILEQGVLALLVLCEGTALVYGITRIAYTGARAQVILVGVLGARLLFHALCLR